jgi:hypothetical protein
MRITFSRRVRRVSAVLAFGAGLLATGVPGAGAAGGDADIRISGGNATTAVVCGNSAAAHTYSEQRHITLQFSRCTSTANGGDADLQNVDIYVRGGAGVRNKDNVLLAALRGTAAVGSAADSCASHRPPGNARQLNQCFSIGHGGDLRLDNVRSVVHRADGSTSTTTITDGIVPLRSLSSGNGGATANCGNLVSNPVSQRDDCTGTGQGATWSMNGVDADVHTPTGTQSRHGIDIVIKGGGASAYIACFNVLDGNNRVIQINVCNANANAGDVSLSNVTIHTFS